MGGNCFVSDEVNKLERVEGIEPSYPAWKAGALAVMLYPLKGVKSITPPLILTKLF